MRFALDEDQEELVRTVRQVLDRRGAAVDPAPGDPVGYDAELWTLLCEQVGVSALAVPEQYEGAGATSVETHLVLEALGARLTPSPLLATGVLTVQVIALPWRRVASRLSPPKPLSSASPVILAATPLSRMPHTRVVEPPASGSSSQPARPTAASATVAQTIA